MQCSRKQDVYLQEIVPDGVRARIVVLILLLDAMDFVLRSCIKDIPLSLSSRADLENTSLVSASVAIVGSTPDGGQPVVEHDHVPFITELVGA